MCDLEDGAWGDGPTPVEAGSSVLHALYVQNVHVALPTWAVAEVLGLDPEALGARYGPGVCPCSAVNDALFQEGEPHPLVAIMTDFADFLAEEA